MMTKRKRAKWKRCASMASPACRMAPTDVASRRQVQPAGCQCSDPVSASLPSWESSTPPPRRWPIISRCAPDPPCLLPHPGHTGDEAGHQLEYVLRAVVAAGSAAHRPPASWAALEAEGIPAPACPATSGISPRCSCGGHREELPNTELSCPQSR